MQDAELINLLRSKRQEGIDALIKNYGPLMRYIIEPILQDYREQEECMSDVTYRIWEKIDLYNEQRGNFKTWISTITRNVAYNRAKSCKNKGEYQEISEDLVSEQRGPEEEVLRQENLQKLRIALGELSHKDKLLIYRKYYYLQSTAQIAAELGLTERAVEGRLYRIKKKLRGKWDE